MKQMSITDILNGTAKSSGGNLTAILNGGSTQTQTPTPNLLGVKPSFNTSQSTPQANLSTGSLTSSLKTNTQPVPLQASPNTSKSLSDFAGQTIGKADPGNTPAKPLSFWDTYFPQASNLTTDQQNNNLNVSIPFAGGRMVSVPNPIQTDQSVTPGHTLNTVSNILANIPSQVIQAVPRALATIYEETKNSTVQGHTGTEQLSPFMASMYGSPTYQNTLTDVQNRLSKGDGILSAYLGAISNKVLDVAFGGAVMASGFKILSKVLSSDDLTSQIEAWKTLGSPTSEEDLQANYRSLAAQLHPDKLGGDSNMMSVINQAKEVLDSKGIPNALDLTQQKMAQYSEVLGRQTNLGQPLYGLNVTPKVPEGNNLNFKSLPGYRPEPGQAPAFGLSIQRVEPVGFADQNFEAVKDNITGNNSVGATNYDRAIEAGDIQASDVYKDPEAKIFLPDRAKAMVGDVGANLDKYQPGLSQKLAAEVDVNNATADEIKSAAVKLLDAAHDSIPPTPPDLPVETPSSGEAPPAAIAGAAKNLVPDIVGERNVRITQVNQIAEQLKNTLTLPEQEALTFYRDYKGNPQGLAKLTTDPKLAKYQQVIQLAMNPSPAMVSADKIITDYFTKTLAEGKSLGTLDSSIASDKYITHLLAPADAKPKTGLFGGSKISLSTPFAKARTYDTVAEAVQNGVKVKSINALDALKIYGEKHAVAVSTKMGVDSLKDLGVGKFGFKGSDNIPKDWVVADPSNRFFRNTVPFITPEGKPSFAYQDLYVPPQIAKVLKPMIQSDFTGQIPGFSQMKLYQGYLKGVQLGLSVFHIKAMQITSLNNAGVIGNMKSIFKAMDSDLFRTSEQDFVKHGGISPILGHTMEAYKGLMETSIPSRLDILKKATGIQAVDAFSKKLTNFTFNIIQRKFKVQDYALKTASWIAKNPNATEEALVTAKRSIAKEVNAAYGGLNWETLGVSKSTLNVTRMFLLAPDWTFSNFFNAKYAFEGGPAGSAARKFWIRSAITGAALSYGMSILLTGKADKPSLTSFTNVRLGKDKNGKDIYQNMFFAGAPSDAINLINNVADYGFIQGFAQSLAAKASPAVRTAIQIESNKNYLGQAVVPKGMGPVAGTARSLYTILVGVSPVPFTVSTFASMLLDPQQQYTPEEYITALAGTRPRHVIPDGLRQVPSGSRKGQLVPQAPQTKRSLLDQITSGKIYQPKKKSGGSFTNILNQ